METKRTIRFRDSDAGYASHGVKLMEQTPSKTILLVEHDPDEG